jgi:hypothetical protein
MQYFHNKLRPSLGQLFLDVIFLHSNDIIHNITFSFTKHNGAETSSRLALWRQPDRISARLLIVMTRYSRISLVYPNECSMLQLGSNVSIFPDSYVVTFQGHLPISYDAT